MTFKLGKYMTFKLEKVLRILSKIILNMKLSLKNDQIGLV
jgi:hypothetical protein